MESEDDAEVFKALADATRRRLLDALLAADGRSVGELCELVPEMTRFGVMKHLGVLEAAGLVTVIRVARTKRHYLNAVPIARIAHRWIDKYAAPYASALVELDAQATSASDRWATSAPHAQATQSADSGPSATRPRQEPS